MGRLSSNELFYYFCPMKNLNHLIFNFLQEEIVASVPSAEELNGYTFGR